MRTCTRSRGRRPTRTRQDIVAIGQRREAAHAHVVAAVAADDAVRYADDPGVRAADAAALPCGRAGAKVAVDARAGAEDDIVAVAQCGQLAADGIERKRSDEAVGWAHDCGGARGAIAPRGCTDVGVETEVPFARRRGEVSVGEWNDVHADVVVGGGADDAVGGAHDVTAVLRYPGAAADPCGRARFGRCAVAPIRTGDHGVAVGEHDRVQADAIVRGRSDDAVRCRDLADGGLGARPERHRAGVGVGAVVPVRAGHEVVPGGQREHVEEVAPADPVGCRVSGETVEGRHGALRAGGPVAPRDRPRVSEVVLVPMTARNDVVAVEERLDRVADGVTRMRAHEAVGRRHDVAAVDRRSVGTVDPGGSAGTCVGAVGPRWTADDHVAVEKRNDRPPDEVAGVCAVDRIGRTHHADATGRAVRPHDRAAPCVPVRIEGQVVAIRQHRHVVRAEVFVDAAPDQAVGSADHAAHALEPVAPCHRPCSGDGTRGTIGPVRRPGDEVAVRECGVRALQRGNERERGAVVEVHRASTVVPVGVGDHEVAVGERCDRRAEAHAARWHWKACVGGFGTRHVGRSDRRERGRDGCHGGDDHGGAHDRPCEPNHASDTSHDEPPASGRAPVGPTMASVPAVPRVISAGGRGSRLSPPADHRGSRPRPRPGGDVGR